MKVNLTQARQLVEIYLKAKIVPMLHSSPGVGKSMTGASLAQQFGLKLIDERLAQCDPTDLKGLPNLSGDKANFLPFDTFPIEGDKVPDGYKGWLIFLDELSTAAPAVQAAAYKLILDRKVGQHKLHDRVAIIAAGNLETDNAIVEQMSTALQSRMAHIEIEVDSAEWLEWADLEKFDTRVTSYIGFRPDNLMAFNPQHSDMTYACPRTWMFANQVIKQVNESSPNFLPALSGVLSEGVAREFVAHCKIFKELPTIAQITANPKAAPVPDEPGVLWALCGVLSEHMKPANCEALLEYTSRLPMEFVVITTRSAIRRNPELKKEQPMIKLVMESSLSIF